MSVRPVNPPRRIGCFDVLLGLWGLYSLVAGFSFFLDPSSSMRGGYFFVMLMGAGCLYWFARRRGWLVPKPSQSVVDPATLPPPASYILTPGNAEAWNADKAIGLIKALVAQIQQTSVSLWVTANGEGIKFVVYMPYAFMSLESLQHVISGLYPTMKVEAAPFVDAEYPLERRYTIFAQSAYYLNFEAIKTARDIQKKDDPLATLASIIRDLRPGEQAIYGLTIFDGVQFSQRYVQDLLTTSALAAGESGPVFYGGGSAEAQVGRAVGTLIRQGLTKVERYNASDKRRYLSKLTQPLYVAALFASFDSPDPARLELLNTLAAPVKAFNEPDRPMIEAGFTDQAKITSDDGWAAFFPPFVLRNWAKSKDKQQKQNADAHQFLFTLEELAALWHLPHDGFPDLFGKKQVEMPRAMQGETNGIVVGINEFGSKRHEVHLLDADRQAHMSVLGRTETGKSTLLQQMITQDIKAGRGVAVIDPHGTLVTEILRYGIPKEREADVVVLDIANKEYPPPLNPLMASQGLRRSSGQQLVAAILTQLGKLDSKLVAEPNLKGFLATLMYDDTPTLRDIARLFDNLDYRNSLKQKADDNDALWEFWDGFEKKTEGQQNQIRGPVVDRVQSFYSHEHVQLMTCHPQGLELERYLTENKIVLVALRLTDKRLADPADQELLGAALLSQFQEAAVRENIPHPPYYLYVDETQYFVTTGIAKMLSEVRKEGMGLVLAHQYLGQLGTGTLDALIGNVGAMICFQLGDKDSNTLDAYTKQSDITADDLLNQDKYHAVVITRYHDETQKPFTMTTLPPEKPTDEAELDAAKAREQRIRDISRQCYTPMSRAEVKAWLRKRYPRSVTPVKEQQKPSEPEDIDYSEFGRKIDES